MEIARGLICVPSTAETYMGVYAPNVYIVGEKRFAIIDTGYGGEINSKFLLDNIKGAGVQSVDHTFLTHLHPDHAGNTESIKDKFISDVIAFKSGSYHFTVPQGVLIDHWVKDGEVFDIDDYRFRIIHTPGHCPEHICIYVENTGWLFTGDHILGIGTAAVIPPGGDMAQYIQSLYKLTNYDINIICPGHGPVINAPKQKIQELIEHRLEREKQVKACIDLGRNTPENIIKYIYPELSPRLYRLARGQVIAHIKKLVQEGQVNSKIFANSSIPGGE